MNDIVTKPIDQEKLFKALIKWIKPQKREGYLKSNEVVEKKNDIEDHIDLPVNLSGIDIEKGISIVAGNKKLYKELLIIFYDNYKDSINHVRELIELNDFQKAAEVVHTLKGVCGSIGADNLCKSVEKLETALKTKERNLNDFIFLFEKNLEIVIASIQQVAQMHENIAKTDDIQALSNDEISSILEKLQKMVSEGDAASEEFVLKLEGQIDRYLFDKLKNEINDCEFEDAEMTLLEIKKI